MFNEACDKAVANVNGSTDEKAETDAEADADVETDAKAKEETDTESLKRLIEMQY